MKNISISLTQSATGFTYTNKFELADNIQMSLGQFTGRIANSYLRAVVNSRACGSGAGISLREPFELCIKVDGKVYFNSVSAKAQSKLTTKLTMGLTENGQKRFIKRFCDLLHSVFSVYMEADTYGVDIQDSDILFTADHRKQEIRRVLDTPMVDFINN